MQYFSFVDILVGPVIFLLLVIAARTKKYGMIAAHPEYAYYTKGLYVKMIGGISLCLIYTFYYGGGDTVSYFGDSICMVNLLTHNPAGFLDVMITGLSMENYPVYWRDSYTFMVVRYTTFITMVSAGSFIGATLLFAYISFGGVWRLYKVFILEYPALRKEMAISVLFIPSVFFWASGIMKDTITFSAIGYYTYAFYQIFIRKDKIIGNLITIFVSTMVIMSIKPYIAFALLPGSLIWIVNKFTIDIKNTIIKFMIGPLLLIISVVGGYFTLTLMGGVLGDYTVDRVLEKAVISNQDLKADYYGGNSFDIGDFDPTIQSMLSKAPLALEAALFRPYLWESRNVVMLLSGIESVFLLYFTFRFLIKVRVLGFIKYFSRSHLLGFSMIFALFFGFSVGISTSNFGSLVRYRIPILPFYLGSLFIMEYLYKLDKGYLKAENEENEPEKPAEPKPVA
jgi:hypothetical protein